MEIGWNRKTSPSHFGMLWIPSLSGMKWQRRAATFLCSTAFHCTFHAALSNKKSFLHPWAMKLMNSLHDSDYLLFVVQGWLFVHMGIKYKRMVLEKSDDRDNQFKRPLMFMMQYLLIYLFYSIYDMIGWMFISSFPCCFFSFLQTCKIRNPNLAAAGLQQQWIIRRIIVICCREEKRLTWSTLMLFSFRKVLKVNQNRRRQWMVFIFCNHKHFHPSYLLLLLCSIAVAVLYCWGAGRMEGIRFWFLFLGSFKSIHADFLPWGERDQSHLMKPNHPFAFCFGFNWGLEFNSKKEKTGFQCSGRMSWIKL